MYLECILEYRILRSQSKVYKYSTVHPTRINTILLILLILQLETDYSSSYLLIHAKQWHYSLQHRLPEASFHSFYTKNPRNSSSTNSTSRRQRALQVILHTEGKEIFYPIYKAFQPQDLPQAFQFCKDIPVIPVIHDIPAL